MEITTNNGKNLSLVREQEIYDGYCALTLIAGETAGHLHTAGMCAGCEYHFTTLLKDRTTSSVLFCGPCNMIIPNQTSVPEIIDHNKNPVTNSFVEITCPFCIGKPIYIYIMSEDSGEPVLVEVREEKPSSTEKTNTCQLSNFKDHVSVNHLKQDEKRTKGLIFSNLPPDNDIFKKLIKHNESIAECGNREESAKPILTASPDPTSSENIPSEASSRSEQQSIHSPAKCQKIDPQMMAVEINKCIHFFNDLLTEKQINILDILNSDTKFDDELYQELEGLYNGKNVPTEIFFSIIKYKTEFLERIDPLLTHFDPQDTSYMRRPLSLRDKDPRLKRAICLICSYISNENIRALQHMFEANPFVKNQMNMFSNMITGKIDNFGKKIDLEALLRMSKSNEFRGIVQAIEEAQKISEIPQITKNKALLKMLTKTHSELKKTFKLDYTRQLYETLEDANKRSSHFIIYLFHMTCKASSDKAILEDLEGGNTGKVQSQIIRKMGESENIPFGVIIQALDLTWQRPLIAGFEDWADKRQKEIELMDQ